MKTLLDKLLLFTIVSFSFDAYAQSQSLSSTLEVYAFPKSGQLAAQQSQDEVACYEWAVSHTGNDPFDSDPGFTMHVLAEGGASATATGKVIRVTVN